MDFTTNERGEEKRTRTYFEIYLFIADVIEFILSSSLIKNEQTSLRFDL